MAAGRFERQQIHYAANWPTEGPLSSTEEINSLGRRYAEALEEGEKQALQLEICRAFHPYLMKYLVMICRGHLPVVGVGKKASQINKDVVPFIKYFLPKGQKLNQRTACQVVRHFHLAFKDMDGEEVYNVLMERLISVINKYDPFYTEKVKQISQAIDHELPPFKKQFSAADLNHYLEFDSDRYLRMLCRRVWSWWSKQAARCESARARRLAVFVEEVKGKGI